MNQADTAARQAQAIAPISQAPEALSTIAAKINEIIGALDEAGKVDLVPVRPLQLVVGDSGPPRLLIDIDALSKLLRLDPRSSAGGGGVVGDYNALLDRVVALENRLAGYTAITVSTCESSVSTTRVIFAK